VSSPRIAVIGGGVTGLAAAYELRDEAEVTVFEASDRLGGKVLTEELDGIQIEAGPDSLLARDDAPQQLLYELGLTNDIVEPHNFGAWIATDEGPKRLPDGLVLGVPASPMAIVRSGLLTPAGALRAAGDFVLPRTRLKGDISVGKLIRARFGDQVADRMVGPLMSGVRSGDIDEMSLEMAAPQIAAVAATNRSVTLGLRKATRTTRRPRFIGLRRGMSSLVTALQEHSGAEIQLSTPIGRVRRDMTIEGRPFDGIVVAVPPFAAAPILDLDRLGDTRFADATVFNLVYPSGAVDPLPSGSGVLVPRAMGMDVVAATWFTSKWPHLAPADGRSVVRCVAGENASEERVTAEVGDVVHAAAPPDVIRAHRWKAAFPEFKVGHKRTIEEAHASLRDRPVRLAGAGYLATGLNDCIAHGRAAAREVLGAAGIKLGS
jgi:oxygen-dependent protoporphyrinogen oxidase